MSVPILQMQISQYLTLLFTVKASSRKTPQPTPALSAPSTVVPVGTHQRLSTLRRDCLIRDRHRCVISRKFDCREADKRLEASGLDAKDDDGRLLKDGDDEPSNLEVAHIIPHSMASSTGASTPLVRHLILASFGEDTKLSIVLE